MFPHLPAGNFFFLEHLILPASNIFLRTPHFGSKQHFFLRTPHISDCPKSFLKNRPLKERPFPREGILTSYFNRGMEIFKLQLLFFRTEKNLS